jgi:hypothetical protein
LCYLFIGVWTIVFQLQWKYCFLTCCTGQYKFCFTVPGTYFYWSGYVDDVTKQYLLGRVEVGHRHSSVASLSVQASGVEAVHDKGLVIELEFIIDMITRVRRCICLDFVRNTTVAVIFIFTSIPLQSLAYYGGCGWWMVGGAGVELGWGWGGV